VNVICVVGNGVDSLPLEPKRPPRKDDISNLVLFMKHCNNSWKQMEKQVEKECGSDLATLMGFKPTFTLFRSYLDKC
jgi:hypothetical protein